MGSLDAFHPHRETLKHLQTAVSDCLQQLSLTHLTPGGSSEGWWWTHKLRVTPCLSLGFPRRYVGHQKYGMEGRSADFEHYPRRSAPEPAPFISLSALLHLLGDRDRKPSGGLA